MLSDKPRRTCKGRRHWPRDGVCIGHDKPPGQEWLEPGSCLELQLVRHAPAPLCPACALMEHYSRCRDGDCPPCRQLRHYLRTGAWPN